tara:strand:+ start:887 stop:1147 length:261 start_codon:yes stop_codon:yes gene_type:complete
VPETEISDQLAVSLDIGPLHIFEKTTSATNHLKQATTTVMVLPMLIEVGPEVINAGREDRNLDRRASTIGIVELVLLNNFFLYNRH